MALIIDQGEAKSQFKIFKLRQGSSMTTNIGLSVGLSKKNLVSFWRGFVDNTNIYNYQGPKNEQCHTQNV